MSSSTYFFDEGSDHFDVEEARLPYKQVRILSSGGCSVVDEVQDCNTGQHFARKVFLRRRRNRARVMEIFENELRITRSLGKHHHMISIYTTYTTTNRLAMILSPVAD
jgi:serine/threonine protein kinase